MNEHHVGKEIETLSVLFLIVIRDYLFVNFWPQTMLLRHPRLLSFPISKIKDNVKGSSSYKLKWN